MGKDPIVEYLRSHAGEEEQKKHAFGARFSNPLVWTLFILQSIFGVLFAIFVKYGVSSDGKPTEDGSAVMSSFYGVYMDVHVMIFIGFGFLMTFLRKYGYSSVGITFLLGAICIQWYILVGSFFEQIIYLKHFENIHINIPLLIRSDFAAGAVLITFGALLGKTSALQMIFVAILELVFYSINEAISLNLGIADIGGSMVIHMFGAYFGLAASIFITPSKAKGNKDNSAVYHSDLFSMIGTIFLWMYWPSFNGALLGSSAGQQRAVRYFLIFLFFFFFDTKIKLKFF